MKRRRAAAARTEECAAFCQLLKATRQLMKELRYTGVAMAEFKVNPRTGGWVLIEINGRFGLSAADDRGGRGFPAISLRADGPRTHRVSAGISNGSILPELAARPGVAEAQSSGRPRRRHAPDGAFVESRAGAPPGISGAQRHVHAGRSESRGSFELAQFAGQVLRPFVWILPGIRARMRRRAEAAACDARRILVVCKGKNCRSPFAEAYLKRRAGANLEVESAGHYPAEGRAIAAGRAGGGTAVRSGPGTAPVPRTDARAGGSGGTLS